MRATRTSKQTSQHIGRALLAGLLLICMAASTTLAAAAPLSVGKRLEITQKRMSVTSARISKLVDKRKKVEIQLEIATENYNGANEKYQKAQSRLDFIRGNLKVTAKSLKFHEKLLNSRVRGIYRRGDTDIVAFVVSSTDWNDLVTRLHMLTLIAEQDAGIVGRVRYTRDKLNSLEAQQRAITKRRLSSMMAMRAARHQVAVKMDEYNGIIKQVNAYFAQLAKNERKLAVAYAIQVARQQRIAAARAAALGNSVGWIPPPGWVPPPGGRPEAVALAMKELGKPYQWGATGPDSFDCSGLCYYVYGKLGINLPRVSRDMYWAGMHVNRSQLKPGDLVFFSYDGGPGGIHHVGMYIGDGHFIEAPHSGDVVKISTLGDRGDFIGGTRI
jgi:peptidoglycan DL-endopeptidase CwlO